MSEFFSGAFGISFPYTLVGSIAVASAVLYYAYLRRGRLNQVVVSTTLLLRRLAGHASTRKKFVPPFRFFFELLLLLLLCLNLAGIYRATRKESVAILVDNSLSMGWINEQGISLLEKSKADAEERLSTLGDSVLVQIFQTSPTLRALSDNPESGDQALTRLASIKVEYAEDLLSQSISRLAHDSEYSKIYTYSDRLLVVPPQMTERVLPQSVASNAGSSGNLAISDVKIDGQEIVVQVANFGARDALGILKLIQMTGEGRRFAEFEIGAHNLRLSKNKYTLDKFPLPTGGTLFKIILEADPLSRDFTDAIQEDNQTYFSVVTGLAIGVQSDLSLSELGLNRIDRFSFEVSQGELADGGAQYPAQLLHRVAVTSEPKHNSLIVMPHSTPWSGNDTQFEQAQITSWDKSSHILDYLNLASVRLKSGFILTPPDWASVLIRSDKGVIAWQGERQGRRIVCFGFEIFPYQGVSDPTLSILTLNTLKYLTQDSNDAGNLTVGAAIHKLRDETDYVANSDDMLSANNAQTFTAYKPGIVRLLKGERTSRELAMSFYSDSESNPSSNPSTSVPVAIRIATTSEERENLGDLLAKLALLMLAIDLILHLTVFQNAAGGRSGGK